MNALSLVDYRALKRLKQRGPGHLSEVRATSLLCQGLVRSEGKKRYAISAEGIATLAEHTSRKKCRDWAAVDACILRTIRRSRFALKSAMIFERAGVPRLHFDLRLQALKHRGLIRVAGCTTNAWWSAVR